MKKFLGYNLYPLTFEETKEKIINFLKEDKKRVITPINPEKIVKSLNDAKLKEILENSDLLLPDGYGIVIASKILGIGIKERITGIDMFEALLKYGDKENLSIYFLGAKEDVVKAVIEKVKKEFKGIKIAGFHNGFFSDPNEVLEDMKDKKIDILFVAMGSPKQEYFIYDNLKYINAKISMGVGGSFDVFSGKIKRAPKLIRKLGLEWFYRFILEPKKRFPRVLLLFKFIFIILKEKFKIGKS
ncbi:MAG: WecB/TagA/CpsF family glycosyltransferase [Caldisericia bacterium]|jgi:N-acetylglucosaminyldiphosphoundecaprenol N-acetyl-beta-D-mannosaminyltransferase|nr:WecB/TagA/CpsF family glycosyltransferase [Caldisericia bacterium]